MYVSRRNEIIVPKNLMNRNGVPFSSGSFEPCRLFIILITDDINNVNTDTHISTDKIMKIMKVRFAGCLRLICIAVAGLGAPLSRFLEGATYKFLNE